LVDLIALTNAFADTLAAIPELPPLLVDPAAVIAYIDRNPTMNALAAAIYQMKPGSVLVVWLESVLTQGEMEGWLHRYAFYVKALRNESPLDIIRAIVNGIPVPGDGQRWRYCPVLDGMLPTNIVEISRPTDEEGVDYYQILSETKETGDI